MPGQKNSNLPSWNAPLSRRLLLRRAGTSVAAAALAPAARLFAADASPVMKQLSEYMSAARDRALPVEVTEKAKHHILDTFAAMISGSQLKPGAAALKFAEAYGGPKVATIVCSNLLCGPIEAAFVNAIQAHSDETDDSHTISAVHPGAATVAATLAAGEQFGISGAHFVRAVTLGYDIGPRVVLVLGGPDYQTVSHRSVHSLGAVFSASAAAGSAASLNSQQMRWLLDYTSQQASGIAAWARDTEHMEKSFVFAGGPARNGVTGALLVQQGWTGVDDVFTGADNFFDAFQPKADIAALTDRLGEHYDVAETNIKKWSVGSPIQATLDALVNLRGKRAFQADDVKQVIVRIETREAGVVDNRTMPDVCLQHMVAVMLVDKNVSFASAHDKARMTDPEILRHRAKVQLLPDPELARLMPKRVTIVDIVFNDGTRLSERIEAVRGAYDNPMNREEVVGKSRDLITPVFGEARTGRLIDKLLDLENVPKISDLRPLLQKA